MIGWLHINDNNRIHWNICIFLCIIPSFILHVVCHQWRAVQDSSIWLQLVIAMWLCLSPQSHINQICSMHCVYITPGEYINCPFGGILYKWNDTEKISMAPVQGWHAQIEKWSKFCFAFLSFALHFRCLPFSKFDM